MPSNAHTCCPSVTGDGEAELPSSPRTSLLPWPSFLLHCSFPSVPKQISSKSSSSTVVTTVTGSWAGTVNQESEEDASLVTWDLTTSITEGAKSDRIETLIPEVPE